MPKTLKKFWSLKLRHLSPIHAGMGSSDSYMGAADVVQNGAGEYVIPGTSLTGLFFSRMQRSAIRADKDDLFNKLLADDQGASFLIFRTLTLKQAKVLLRDRVGIDPKTKTAADGAKFSQWEVLPQTSTMLIELDNVSKAGSMLDNVEVERIEAWVQQVIASWSHEGFFLGAHSSVGNGYTRVEKAKHCRITKDNYEAYLDASYHSLADADMGWEDLDLDQKFIPAFIKRYKITVNTGLQDPLLIKGNSYSASRDNPETDAPFINRDGKIFIPGSSMRGAINSFMNKYELKDWDILSSNATNKLAASHIIFSDLNLMNESKAKLIQIERHAEDQLSRAIYGSGKFDEERVFNAEFSGELMIKNVPQGMDDDSLESIIAALKFGMKYRLIGLGAGSAHPEMHIEEVLDEKVNCQ